MLYSTSQPSRYWIMIGLGPSDASGHWSLFTMYRPAGQPRWPRPLAVTGTASGLPPGLPTGTVIMTVIAAAAPCHSRTVWSDTVGVHWQVGQGSAPARLSWPGQGQVRWQAQVQVRLILLPQLPAGVSMWRPFNLKLPARTRQPDQKT